MLLIKYRPRLGRGVVVRCLPSQVEAHLARLLWSSWPSSWVVVVFAVVSSYAVISVCARAVAGQKAAAAASDVRASAERAAARMSLTLRLSYN